MSGDGARAAELGSPQAPRRKSRNSPRSTGGCCCASELPPASSSSCTCTEAERFCSVLQERTEINRSGALVRPSDGPARAGTSTAGTSTCTASTDGGGGIFTPGSAPVSEKSCFDRRRSTGRYLETPVLAAARGPAAGCHVYSLRGRPPRNIHVAAAAPPRLVSTEYPRGSHGAAATRSHAGGASTISLAGTHL